VSGGYLYSVNASTGAITGSSGQLDNQWGIRDAPLVDSTAGEVYAFAGDDTGGSTGVFQFPTNFTTGTGTESIVEGGTNTTGANEYQFAGTFDNLYYTSATPTTPTGNLYVCAVGGGFGESVLWQVPITANVIGGNPTAGQAVGNDYCSGVTEFYNTAATPADLIFFSVQEGFQAGCTGAADTGCVMSYDVTVPGDFPLGPDGELNVSAAGTPAAVTGGIIVDNGLAGAGESQIYFSTTDPTGTTPCSGLCAIQASQTAP
jgi:hypothetical protein